MKILNSLKYNSDTPQEYIVLMYKNGAQEWFVRSQRHAAEMAGLRSRLVSDVKSIPICIVYNTGDVIRLDTNGNVVAIETHDGIYLEI
jgi:hypothetical protein